MAITTLLSATVGRLTESRSMIWYVTASSYGAGRNAPLVHRGPRAPSTLNLNFRIGCERHLRATTAGRAHEQPRSSESGLNEIAAAPADQHVDLRPRHARIARPHDLANNIVGDEVAG